MDNRGFTLVELTAIIIILALIFLVAFPNLQSIVKNDKEKQYETMVKDLCLAGEEYIYSNLSNFGEFIPGEKIEIVIDDLIKNDVIDDKINPKSKKSVKYDMLIYTVLADETLECSYNDKKEG